MSLFVLKVIALTSMIIDHFGEVLYQRNFPSWNMYVTMRAIGRFAFPIYAFCLVNGFQKTSNRVKYLNRLFLFAVVSEIPHSLVFTTENYGVTDFSRFYIGPKYSPIMYILFCICAMAVYCIYIAPADTALDTTTVPSRKRLLNYLLPILFLIVGGVEIIVFNYVILDYYLSIFYTLSLGLCSMWLLENIIERKQTIIPTIIQLGVLIWAVVLLQKPADYSWLGLVFIVALYLARNDRYSQAGVIALFCVAEYMQNARMLLYFSFLSIIPILMYNGKKGRPMKTLFYLMYPLHLLVLGVANILF